MSNFVITTYYKDGTIKNETSNNISSALSAAAIYFEDPECAGVVIWDDTNGIKVMDYFPKEW